MNRDGYPKVWDRQQEKLVPAAEYYSTRSQSASGPMVIRDIEPYRSVVTGEIVSGRRQHRDHLRQHGLIEVGNERLQHRQKPMDDPRLDIVKAMKKHGKIG